MSDFADLVDAVAADLTTNVAELADVVVHKLEPWDPQELENDGGRHLGVWPEGEGAEAASPMATGVHDLVQGFVVLYWEPADVESSRLIRDETKARALYELHNKVRARFYVESNQQRAGYYRIWYSASAFADRVARVRWFAMHFTAARPQSFT